MKKLLSGTLLLALVFASVTSMAGMHIDLSLSLPLPIIFVAPPELVVLPGTNVYVAPDVDTEIFFYSGWWWRPSGRRWYRSRNYDSGWKRYRKVPSFYRSVPSGWRTDYNHNRWKGREWQHQRTPHRNVQQNWSQWEKSRYWEKQHNWGVRDPEPQNRERARHKDNRSTKEKHEHKRNNRSDRLNQEQQERDRNNRR